MSHWRASRSKPGRVSEAAQKTQTVGRQVGPLCLSVLCLHPSKRPPKVIATFPELPWIVFMSFKGTN